MAGKSGALSTRETARLIRRKELSPVEVVRGALDRAEATQPTLNAFTVLRRQGALKEAAAAEEAVMRGEPLGTLHGLPISTKDVISVAGLPYASGSRAMEGNIGKVDAPLVERARTAGAILIGKTTTSEFGCEPVGDSPLTGVTRNPLDLSLTPGGSSAGCAASVAAGIAPFGLGTDGAARSAFPQPSPEPSASKRISAACWYGPPPRRRPSASRRCGLRPARSRRHAAPVPDFLAACEAPLGGLRIAWSPTLGYAKPDSEVVEICGRAAHLLERAGCMVEEVKRVFAADPEDLWAAEFYAGVGARLRPILETPRELLDPAVADILEAALKQEMRAYYDTVFRRYALRDEMAAFFSRYDALLSPTLPVSALETGRNIPDELEDRSLVSWVYYTYPFNLTGEPAASLPAGLSARGLQIVTPRNDEERALRIAAWLERELANSPVE